MHPDEYPIEDYREDDYRVWRLNLPGAAGGAQALIELDDAGLTVALRASPGQPWSAPFDAREIHDKETTDNG